VRLTDDPDSCTTRWCPRAWLALEAATSGALGVAAASPQMGAESSTCVLLGVGPCWGGPCPVLLIAQREGYPHPSRLLIAIARPLEGAQPLRLLIGVAWCRRGAHPVRVGVAWCWEGAHPWCRQGGHPLRLLIPITWPVGHPDSLQLVIGIVRPLGRPPPLQLRIAVA
jgi:hypothetical protein